MGEIDLSVFKPILDGGRGSSALKQNCWLNFQFVDDFGPFVVSSSARNLAYRVKIVLDLPERRRLSALPVFE